MGVRTLRFLRADDRGKVIPIVDRALQERHFAESGPLGPAIGRFRGGVAETFGLTGERGFGPSFSTGVPAVDSLRSNS